MKCKKNNIIRYLLVLGLMTGMFCFGLNARAAAEKIESFDANIAVQNDGSLSVTEKILYNFGSNQRHGIYRDIPLTSANGPKLVIDVSGVSNESGEEYNYTTSTSGGILHIKIGDPQLLISGTKNYIINYTVYNSIRTFKDHDELYWNVTGDQWPVAIGVASAIVTLPDSSMTNLQMSCFTGPLKSTQKDCTYSQSDTSHVNYLTTKLLGANDGLTIVLGMPVGYIQNEYVQPPEDNSYASSESTDGGIASFEMFNVVWFFIFFVFVAMSIIIAKSSMSFGQRYKPTPVIPKELKNQPIVVEYDAPDNLSPIEIGTILDRRVDLTDISSVIVDLAIRGYLKIKYSVSPTKIDDNKNEFEFIKLKAGSDLTQPADQIIFNLLFKDRDSVSLKDLETKKLTFQSNIKKIINDTEQQLRD